MRVPPSEVRGIDSRNSNNLINFNLRNRAHGGRAPALLFRQIVVSAVRSGGARRERRPHPPAPRVEAYERRMLAATASATSTAVLIPPTGGRRCSAILEW